MSDDVLIQVEGVSKRFCRSLKRALWYGVRDIAGELLGRNGEAASLRPGEFWAVDDISFQLRRGECLGLIGPNGAGKSTLLKMLNGLIKPDRGRIAIRGRVGALIELGTGFNPILTGRENIYNNAAVLGIGKRETDRKLQDIIDFAEIGDALDAPVQSYSSGMRVRLGFAVAAYLEPDVFLLDEVLAVGDAAFRNKCYHRIVSLRKRAATVFVAHSMEAISRLCDRTLVMAHGREYFAGEVGGGVNAYETLNEGTGDDDNAFLALHPPLETFRAELPEEVVSGKPLRVQFHVSSTKRLTSFRLRIIFYNPAGAFAADANLLSTEYGIVLPAGESQWEVAFDSLPLKNGSYRIGINLLDADGDHLVWSYKEYACRVGGGYGGAMSDCQLQPRQWVAQPLASRLANE